MNHKIRLALIGCGKISRKYSLAVKNIPDICELTAAADSDKNSLQAFTENHAVATYTDIGEMLECHPEIDLVAVLTPSGLHHEHALKVLEHGKHALIEKPLALSEEKASELIENFSSKNKRLFVMRQNRSNPAVMKLKKALLEGRLGKVHIVNFTMRWSRDQKYFNEKPWRGTRAMDGGILMNQANHFVDLLFWLFGRVETIAAFSDSFLMDVETEDSMVASMRLRSGGIGTFEATIATRPHDLEGSITVLGEKGSVKIGGFSANSLEIWDLEDSPGDTEFHKIKAIESEDSEKSGSAHERFLKKILQEFDSPSPILLAGAEDIESLRFIQAASESITKSSELSIKL